MPKENNEQIEIPEGMCPAYHSQMEEGVCISEKCLISGWEADEDGCHKDFGAASCQILIDLVYRAKGDVRILNVIDEESAKKAVEFYKTLRCYQQI